MKKQKVNHTSLELELSFSNFKPVNNSGFVRGECKIAYAGKNRNFSNIPKKSFEDAEETLYGIPVVGNWLEESKNFGGHDVLFETKGNEISIKNTTIPYGFVPQDANPRWTSVEDEDGNIKNYYTSDVILWKERFPEQVEFIEKNKINQSMEIMVEDGDWDDNWEYFIIDKFRFFALCLLGRDRDEDDNKGELDVEPCFENSEITINEFSINDNIQKELNSMKSQYESFSKSFNKEEGKKMSNKNKEKEAQVITYEKEFNDASQKLAELRKEFEVLKSKNDKLEEANKELEQYKADKEAELALEEKEKLIESYEVLLEKDEMKDITDNINEFSVDEVKTKLALIYSEKGLREAVEKAEFSQQSKDVVFDNRPVDTEIKKNDFAI